VTHRLEHSIHTPSTPKMTYRKPALLALAISLAVLALVPSVATAQASPKLWEKCPPGSGAGQCEIPRGIGVDPNTPGHLFVADQATDRIVELNAWGAFQKAWGWGVADGSAELQTCGPAATPPTVGCFKERLRGSGTGQFNAPQGVTVDSSGGVYVVDWNNHRVQKFDSEGNFLLMLGGEVNKTKSEELGSTEAQRNLCTASSGDICQAGTTGIGNGQFSEWPISSYIAVDTNGTATDADDTVYVGDKDRIQKFDTAGIYAGQILLPEAGAVGSLAVDPSTGDLYFARSDSQPNVFRLDSTTGEVLDTLEVEKPTAIATAVGGSVYVFTAGTAGKNSSDPGIGASLRKFDSAGDFVEVIAQNPGFNDPENFTKHITGIATGSACHTTDHNVYLANAFFHQFNGFVRAYGPPPDKTEDCPPPKSPPSIDAQYATSVDTEAATLGAQINPRFWADTSYWVQYGTAECIEAEGWQGTCVQEHPAPPGSQLGAGIIDAAVATKGVFLSDLEPATTYRYRFASLSTGSEGAPVFGRDGTLAEDGATAFFRTPPLPSPANLDCPNQAFRVGLSASLPNCRAYELVSPLDKEGGDIAVRGDFSGFLARLNQSATSGDAFTYSSYRAFGGAQGAPYSSQYIARRQTGKGWLSEAISPAQEGVEFLHGFHITKLYQAFSADLSEGWLLTNSEPVLGPGGQPGFANLYRRESLKGDYEGCTTAPQEVELPSEEIANYEGPIFKGASADGRTAVFSIKARMTPDAAPNAVLGEKYQLYACYRGGDPTRDLHLVSVLPDGTASPLSSTAGTINFFYNVDYGHTSTLAHAISDDGSRIFWSTGNSSSDPGTIYLRENPDQTESARLHGVATGSGDLVGPASGTGKTNSTKTITQVVAKSGTFVVGQEISGPGIPAGSTITHVEVEGTRLKISNPASETTAGVELTAAGSSAVSGAQATSGAFQAGQEISGSGIPGETTIVAIEETAPEVFKLILSAKATQTATASALSATSECTEAQMACTIRVSSGNAQFWTAAADGSRTIFSENQVLYEFDAVTQTTQPIAGKSLGVLGASEDASRVYFASEVDLDETGPAEAGQPNLYLYEAGEGGGTYTFVAALSQTDVNQRAGSGGIFFPSPVNPSPGTHTSRVNADGAHLAFTSNSAELAEQIAGYDNTDLNSGEPDSEVYRYEASTEQLDCVSCNPSGARPVGRKAKHGLDNTAGLWAAASIPPWATSFHAPRALSDDGSVLFFGSFEALVPTDTNAKQDVYQWAAPGEDPTNGRCTEDSPSFSPFNGGCLDLISSGKSPADSEFIDASADGRDVFFATAQSLLPQDSGQYDIYDARSLGGFPAPEDPPPACEGEACQGSSAPPEDLTPASATFQGAGNVVEGSRSRCARKQVRRKGRCVAKRQRKGAKRHQPANHKREDRR
jgi:NHL repeat